MQKAGSKVRTTPHGPEATPGDPQRHLGTGAAGRSRDIVSPAVLSVSFNVDCASQGQEKPPPKAHKLIETIQSPLRPLKCCRRALPDPSACPGQGLRASALGTGSISGG